MSAKELLVNLRAQLAEQQATLDKIARDYNVASAARSATRDAIRAAEFQAWLEDDRVEFPTPEHGMEKIVGHGSTYRQREIQWVESRTEKGSIRLATEIRQPNRRPERRLTMTLRVGTADYAKACKEFGVKS